MSDPRIWPCQWCGSEGRVYSGHPNDPNPRDEGACEACEGTGGEVIEVEPIEMEDMPDYECENCIGMREHGCYCKAMGAIAPGVPAK